MSSLLADAGRALFGERWQSELARSLDVNDRQVRRWVAGEYDPPAGVYTDLLRLVLERMDALEQVETRLRNPPVTAGH